MTAASASRARTRAEAAAEMTSSDASGLTEFGSVYVIAEDRPPKPFP